MSELLPEGLNLNATLTVAKRLCSVYTYTCSVPEEVNLPWSKIVADILAGYGLVGSAAELGRGGIHFLSGGQLPYPIVVRQYRHGGLGRFLSGGRFFSKSRFLSELKLHEVVRELGVPTASALAVIVVKAPASTFINGYYVTRRLSGAIGLPEFLGKSDSLTRLKSAFMIGAYLRKLHDHGIFYTDMHVKNILVGSSGELFFIDFDKARLEPAPLSGRRRRANLYRFIRSVDKYCHRGGKITAADYSAFLVAYEPDPEKYLKLYQRLSLGLSWRGLFYRFGWWLNRS